MVFRVFFKISDNLFQSGQEICRHRNANIFRMRRAQEHVGKEHDRYNINSEHDWLLSFRIDPA